MNGKSEYRCPVIYVSKTFNNENPVDVDKLAKRLRGMAHVLVQEDLSLNKEIQTACSEKNEYKGAIGIYLPGSSEGHKKLMYRREVGADPMLMDKVIKLVLQYCNSLAIEPEYTWQGINNKLLIESLNSQKRAREEFETKYRDLEEKRQDVEAGLNEESERIYEEARQIARREADELLAEFDEQLEELKNKIAELTDKINNLTRENEGLRYKINATDNLPLLCRGEEDDFYAGEVKDLVLSVLSDALKNIKEKSRRYHVVKDIIDNNDYKHLSEERAEKMKNIVKSYAGMTPKVRQELESLGCVITEGGKHYKVYYYGDPRYWDTFSKTPSDWKTGQKLKSELNTEWF